MLDRDAYLRNYVMGVLVSYGGKTLVSDTIGELAAVLTESVIQGDKSWREEKSIQEMSCQSHAGFLDALP